MKKIKELRAKFTMSWAQPMADFITEKLKTSVDNIPRPLLYKQRSLLKLKK